MTERVSCTSTEERDRLIAEGYVITAIVNAPSSNGATTYILERGSDWSEKLGSK